MLLGGVLSYEIFGHVEDDLLEFIWKKFTFLLCFYWILLENAHHIARSGPVIIYCITLTAEPHFPFFCIHVIKNGFKCPRCVAEQQSLKVSAFAYQNQLFPQLFPAVLTAAVFLVVLCFTSSHPHFRSHIQKLLSLTLWL